MIGFYRYCVTFYSEIEDKELTKTGITSAESYSKAVKHITDFYGEDSIERLMCECIACDTVYECETQYLNPKFY